MTFVNPRSGGGTLTGTEGTPDRQAPDADRGVFGSIGGFFSNAWDDLGDMATGIGTLVGAVVHDTWNAARQSVLKMPWTDPADIAAQQAAGSPTGAFVLDDIAEAVGGYGKFADTGSVVINDFKDRYGPMGHGDFSSLYEHPLSFLSDVLTVATAGGAGAASAASLAGKVGITGKAADVASDIGRAGALVQKAGSPVRAAVAAKVGTEGTVLNRLAGIVDAVQGTERRIYIPETGQVVTKGAARNPVRRAIYQNLYERATTRRTPWHDAQARKVIDEMDALGPEDAVSWEALKVKSETFRLTFEEALAKNATHVARSGYTKMRGRKFVDWTVGQAIGKAGRSSHAVEQAWDQNFADLPEEVLGDGDLADYLMGTQNDLTSDNVVAVRGDRRAEVFDDIGVKTAEYGDPAESAPKWNKAISEGIEAATEERLRSNASDSAGQNYGLTENDPTFDQAAADLDSPDSPRHDRFAELMLEPETKALGKDTGFFSHVDPDTGQMTYWHSEDGAHVDSYLELTSDGHATAVAAKSKQGQGLTRQLLQEHWRANGITTPDAVKAEIAKQSLSRAGANLYQSAADDLFSSSEELKRVATEHVTETAPKLREAFAGEGKVTFRVKGDRATSRKADLIDGRRTDVDDIEAYQLEHEDAFGDAATQQGLLNRIREATGDRVRKVENSVDTPAPDGSRELRVVMEAADGHPYEVRIVTPEAARILKASERTRSITSALIAREKRGILIGDDALALEKLRRLQQHLWENVSDSIRVARGGPAPADLRTRINRFRIEHYAETTDKLLERGLSIHSAFDAAMLPLRYNAGARHVDGVMVGGPSPLQLDDALARSGEMAPVYFPHMDPDRIPARGDFLRRKAGGAPTGRAVTDQNLKQNTAELFSAGRISKDTRTVYRIRAAQAARLVENLDIMDSVVSEYGRPLQSANDFNPETESLFAPGLYKRIAHQHDMMLDELANDPSGKGLGELIEKMEQRNIDEMRALVENGGDIEVFAVPKFVGDRLKQHTKWIPDEGIEATFGSATRLWRSSVLSYSPRWVVNNLLGNVVMAKLQGARLTDVVRMANKRYYAQVLEAMGEDAKAGVTGSLTSSLKAEPRRFSDNTIVTRAANRIQEKSGGRVGTKFQRGADWMQRLNSGMEDRFRAAVYLTAADKKVTRAQVNRFGKSWLRSKQRLESAFIAGTDERLWREAVADVNTALNDYHTASPRAKNLIKPYIAPFWSFYTHSAKTILKMPFDHPAKARALQLLAMVEDERRKEEGFDSADLPEWMKGTSLFTGRGEAGDHRFLSTAGSNPFNTVFDTPKDILHPAWKIVYEHSTGRSSFTGREFTDPNVVSSFGSDQQYRMDPATGKMVPVDKVAPGIFEHLLQQVPQYEQLKDLIAGGTTYDTSGLIDVLRYRIAGGQDVVPRDDEGNPISSRDVMDTLARLFGYTQYDRDVASDHERRLTESAAALAQWEKRQGISGDQPARTRGFVNPRS